AQTNHALEGVGVDRLALLGDGQLALTHQAQGRGAHLGQHALPLLGLQLLGHVRRFNALAADVLGVGLGQFFKNGRFDWIAHCAYMLHCRTGKKAKPTWSRKSQSPKASSPAGRPMKSPTPPSTPPSAPSTASRTPTGRCAAPSGPNRST